MCCVAAYCRLCSLPGSGEPFLPWTMSVQLLGKKELKRLSSVANDGAGAG